MAAKGVQPHRVEAQRAGTGWFWSPGPCRVGTISFVPYRVSPALSPPDASRHPPLHNQTNTSTLRTGTTRAA